MTMMIALRFQPENQRLNKRKINETLFSLIFTLFQFIFTLIHCK